jgi:hypothetical protein
VRGHATSPKPASLSAPNQQSRRPSHLRTCHVKDLFLELDRRGILPTAGDPVLFRAAGRTGGVLLLHVEGGLDPRTLGLLADHTDKAALIRRLLAPEEAA